MREIKFRAWDGKKIYYPDQLIDTGDGLLEVGYFDPSGCPKGCYGHPVMQFTGLLDKNGKEIYEGDIVRGCGEHVGQSDVFYDYGKYQPFNYLGTYNGQEFEVIGNIYQNGELLEVKNERD